MSIGEPSTIGFLESQWEPDTQALHSDTHCAEQERNAKPLIGPIYYTTTFKADTPEEFSDMANVPRHSAFYTRIGNPTHDRVHAVLAALDGTETALVTASGMGAITTTLMALVQAGDHVVAQTRHYMGASSVLTGLLRKFNVEVDVVEQSDVSAIEAAIKPNTKLIYVETPANPTIVLTDLKAVADLARQHNLLTVCDNTFASPINQKPKDLGIDIIVYSATKSLGGHHDLTAGAVCCSKEHAELIWKTHILIGAVLSPMDSWLLLRGLRTLPLRIERMNASALDLAEWLEQHPKVERVYYPMLKSHPQHELALRQMKGGGPVIAFAVKGGYEKTAAAVAALRLATQAVSLGGVETLVVHSAAMFAGMLSPEQMGKAGIEPNFVRLSVGLESAEDLKKDFAQAFDKI